MSAFFFGSFVLSPCRAVVRMSVRLCYYIVISEGFDGVRVSFVVLAVCDAPIKREVLRNSKQYDVV